MHSQTLAAIAEIRQQALPLSKGLAGGEPRCAVETGLDPIKTRRLSRVFREALPKGP